MVELIWQKFIVYLKKKKDKIFMWFIREQIPRGNQNRWYIPHGFQDGGGWEYKNNF